MGDWISLGVTMLQEFLECIVDNFILQRREELSRRGVMLDLDLIYKDMLVGV